MCSPEDNQDTTRCKFHGCFQSFPFLQQSYDSLLPENGAPWLFDESCRCFCWYGSSGLVGQAGTIPTSLGSYSPNNCSCPTIICSSRKSFLLLKVSFNEHQDYAFQHYSEASLMLQYNKRLHCAHFTCEFYWTKGNYPECRFWSIIFSRLEQEHFANFSVHVCLCIVVPL